MAQPDDELPVARLGHRLGGDVEVGVRRHALRALLEADLAVLFTHGRDVIVRLILTQRALNRALLARQGLLERHRGTLPATLERCGTLQAQYAPTMYVSLFSRLEGFAFDALDRALHRRSVVQGTLMRGTIHLVSAADYWPLREASSARPREAFLKAYKVEAARMEDAAARAEALLADGPLPRAALANAIGKTETGGLNYWLPLLRIPPSGTWARRRADLWGLADVPRTDVGDPTRHAVRRYLRGCGPATRADIAAWLGVRPGDLPALDDLRDLGGGLLDLPRMPLPDPGTPAPVRLIGHWDQILLKHARRAGVLREEDAPRIFATRMPRSHAVFLVDGIAAGTWTIDDGFAYDAWRPLDAATRRELTAEGERLLDQVPD